MTPALVLQIFGALLADFPEVLADVETLIASLKGQAPAYQPMLPSGQQATQPVVDELNKTLKP